MRWRDAYLAEAWSDFKIYQMLSANDYPVCHQLHYIQMTTEKLAKGFQCPIHGGPYPRTHVAFVSFLQLIKRQPMIYYRRLGFKSKNQFVAHMPSLLPIADLIEKLVPAGSNYDKMNPEYPWADTANNVYCPASYGFPEFGNRDRELRMTQELLTHLFRLEGYE